MLFSKSHVPVAGIEQTQFLHLQEHFHVIQTFPTKCHDIQQHKSTLKVTNHTTAAASQLSLDSLLPRDYWFVVYAPNTVLHRTNSRARQENIHLPLHIPKEFQVFLSGGAQKMTLTAADTIWAEIPFRSESRITDPWSERESRSFFFLRN